MSQSRTKASRITLDLDRLVRDNTISETEADRLRGLAEEPTARRIFANILLVFGALMVVIGILSLEPPLTVGLILALISLGAGAFLVFRTEHEWGLLGQSLVLMGIVGLGGWAGLQSDELGQPYLSLTAPFIAVITIAGAIVFRNGVLAVLAPLSIANLLGTGTVYWHASYGLFVEEPLITILVFSALSVGFLLALGRLPAAYNSIAVLMGRTSFFMANFGFWVGTLWGDRVGELFVDPGAMDPEASQAWREAALFIPDWVFIIGWTVGLIVAIIVGLRTQRRFIGNTSLVFLAIHFYTQVFEFFLDSPVSMVVAGLSLIAMGFAVVRFDRWQIAQFGQNA